MAKDNMPDFKNSRPPKSLDVKKLAEESGMEPRRFRRGGTGISSSYMSEKDLTAWP
jgi:hypothetical protein